MKISLFTALLLGLAFAGVAGLIGFQVGKTKPEPVEAPAPEAPPIEVVAVKTAPKPAPVSDVEIEELLGDLEPEEKKRELPPGMTEEDMERMEARRERWENMTAEQRQMLRRSIFGALSKVEGLEEVGDAIRQGKLDPKQFKLDPNSIADRMEFFADTMDQESMEAEAASTLQSIVDQARGQMKP